MADEPKLTTADESRPTPERDNGRTEYLLKLTSDRVNGLENALEKNWIAHLILAWGGLRTPMHQEASHRRYGHFASVISFGPICLSPR
jgi:hypothetical protein